MRRDLATWEKEKETIDRLRLLAKEFFNGGSITSYRYGALPALFGHARDYEIQFPWTVVDLINHKGLYNITKGRFAIRANDYSPRTGDIEISSDRFSTPEFIQLVIRVCSTLEKKRRR
jgi:hypothetical protein